jgi:hypothetical protein
MENDLVKATFYLRLLSPSQRLFHKSSQRDLLFFNPVFQPANLAVLRAWTSGGLEWNWSPNGFFFPHF